jgi:hypothetical protein
MPSCRGWRSTTTVAYQAGAVRTTEVSQRLDPGAGTATVKVAPASGTGAGAVRDTVVERVVDGARGRAVP